jgi:hypothetical protein
MSNVYLRMIPHTILLDSFALRFVSRINTYLDPNPHTRAKTWSVLEATRLPRAGWREQFSLGQLLR